MQKAKNKKRLSGIHIFAFVIFTLFLACFIYLNDYYRADETAVEIINNSDSEVTIELKNNTIEFIPNNIEAGLIFYPGGKVQYEAYAPLLSELAKHDILCVLVHMPCNLAVLNMNAADEIMENHSEVSDWYIGGHSLGGAMAANYVEEKNNKIVGLILLAAYSTKDISEKNLKVLSIYGSNDGVLNMEKYGDNKSNLPADTVLRVIEGGNHSGFGAYGHQKGDGEALISSEEQIEETAEEIIRLIFEE